MEEQVLPSLEPYVMTFLNQTKDLREKGCDGILYGATKGHQAIVKILATQSSLERLANLKTDMKETKRIIKEEETRREKQSLKEETSSVMDSKKNE